MAAALVLLAGAWYLVAAALIVAPGYAVLAPTAFVSAAVGALLTFGGLRMARGAVAAGRRWARRGALIALATVLVPTGLWLLFVLVSRYSERLFRVTVTLGVFDYVLAGAVPAVVVLAATHRRPVRGEEN
ncbi:hypothetical protein [Streptomyces alkaliterrae]|uniref:Uncharacterized protein n=1 Tax=Streptomyces alkaliterrae TaxID=2213162 RepID=A0A5P0YPQ7_9ACTN|nr:hypothetical protein [Streptomyces alkaliterrae]MBB1253613.1 hypothetical protein [Streptomyces alkaliterrae]MBB1259737.1 hypothetical protein [Streptomyces alkaliterrae]MQS01890.1 hypothetical protein [Streptomyces alkaliterrae]